MNVVEFDTGENIEWQAQLHKRATDADSVSTFASKTKLINPPKTASKPDHKPKDDENYTPTKNHPIPTNQIPEMLEAPTSFPTARKKILGPHQIEIVTRLGNIVIVMMT